MKQIKHEINKQKKKKKLRNTKVLAKQELPSYF